MLPSLHHLRRERSLLAEVLGNVPGAVFSEEGAGAPPAGADGALGGASALGHHAKRREGREAAAAEGAKFPRLLDAKWGGAECPRGRRGLPPQESGEGLQHLPHELLAAIGEQFLESPVWHACKLGEASPRLGQVFMHESLWRKFLNGRFREAARSPKRCMHPGVLCADTRLSYAQLHALEARFRGGQYAAWGLLDNPHQGVAVLDLHVAPAGDASAVAFAALRDGAVMVYDLDPMGPGRADDMEGVEEEVEGTRPGRGAAAAGVDAPLSAAPLFELAPTFSGGPALCCLPIMEVQPRDEVAWAVPPLLAAGFASGRLGAWQLPSGTPLVPAPGRQRTRAASRPCPCWAAAPCSAPPRTAC